MPRAVREVAPTSVGSGARMREFVKLPPWVYISGLCLRGIFRHYLVTLSFILICVLWYGYGFWLWWLAFVTVIGGWALIIIVYWKIRGGGFKTIWWYWKLHNGWRHAIMGVGLQSRDKLHIPRIYRVRPVKNGLKFVVNMGIAGHTVDFLRAEADDLCEVLGFRRVQVYVLKPAKARMVLYWTTEPIMQVDSIEQISDKLSPEQASAAGLGDYTSIVFGNTGDGPAILSLLLSVFIAGMSRSGKSNLVRVIFHGLIRQQIPHELYVIDPAGGVELGELEHYPHTLAYCDRAKDANKIIKKAHIDMFARLEQMRLLGTNKILPSVEFPLRILIIDELLLLTDQIEAGPKGELGELLITLAKTGGLVIALSQLSDLDSVSKIRKLFPQKICLATDAPETTDAALGKGAEAAGATCSEIGLNMPGVGYMKADGIKGFIRFRIVEAQGSLLSAVKGVKSKHNPNENRRCATYRFYDVTGRCLRVGIAHNPEKREKQYAVQSLWYSSVDHTRTKIDWWENEARALEEETRFIQYEHPVYNVQKQLLHGQSPTVELPKTG